MVVSGGFGVRFGGVGDFGWCLLCLIGNFGWWLLDWVCGFSGFCGCFAFLFVCGSPLLVCGCFGWVFLGFVWCRLWLGFVGLDGFGRALVLFV